MRGFNEWIEMEGLIDLPVPNMEFTWSNMREMPALARLDRMMVDRTWDEVFPGLEDIWSRSTPLRARFPLVFQAATWKEGVVARFWDASNWRIRSTRAMGACAALEREELLCSIQGITIQVGSADRRIWQPTPDKGFMVSMAYDWWSRELIPHRNLSYEANVSRQPGALESKYK
ncbi:hypothetical protein QJS10_CPA10g00771 [Acorus calamus]|uniref:Uncharacterized protein n=1 Tax=Acorus calamus TaxID=4465 RepID=A0AAV9DYV0_ACOCL|nr:hypothetical protein QJS10_CPA10g00771 [Acorus calamus]